MKVGVVLPIAEDNDSGQAPEYREVRDLALQAEAAGFDSVWLFDHLLYRRPEKPARGIWEAWTMLSALADATERVDVGSIVMCTAFRNPALLAKMADTLDEVSGGRLILGLGAGWHQPEFDAFGIPFDHKVDRFEEALQIIVPLLREGRVDFHGTHYQAADCELRPRGPRSAGPPILIGAFGPRMLRLTARYADAWNTCWLGQVSALAEPRAKLEAACADVGRDPASLEVTVGVNVAFPQANDAKETPPPEKALSGSPDEIAAGLRGYADAGVTHAICNLDPMNSATLAHFADSLRI